MLSKIIKSALIFLFVIILGSCSSNPTEFVGKWDTERVIVNGKIQDKPEMTEKWIEFHPDGTYTVGNYLHDKTATGKWEFSSSNKRLKLDSDRGPFDDSRWNVTFKDGKMIWLLPEELNQGYVEIVNIRSKKSESKSE